MSTRTASTSVNTEEGASFVPRSTIWTAVTIVFFFGLFGNMSTSTLGIITPGLIKDVHLTPVEVGTIGTVMNWLAIPMAFLAAWVSDLWGPRLVGFIATGVAAITNIAFPAVSSFGGFLVNRVAFELGGVAGNGGIGNRLIGGTVSSERRGMSASIFNITFPFGTLLLVTVGTIVISSSVWSTWMYVLGGFGVVMAVVWLFMTRQAHFKAGPHGRVGAGQASGTLVGLRDVFKSRTLLGIGLGWGFSAWSFVFLVGWLPLYFVQARHMPFREAGFSSIAPWVGGIVGGVLTGFITDALLRRTHNYRISRTYLAVLGQIVFFVCLVLVAFVQSLTAIFVLLFIAEMFNQVSACMFQVVPIDTVPASAGSATSYVHVVTGVVAAFSPLVAGGLFQAHLYNEAFIIAGLFPLVGSILMWWLVYPGELRPWGERPVKPSGPQVAG